MALPNTKIVKDSVKRKPPAAGKGRPKGAANKNTKALKDMILGALEKAGGEDYLQRQADDNPNAFLTLIGKVLPTELKGNLEGNLVVNVITGVPRE